MSAPPPGFRPKCTACGGEKFTPSGVCLDCPHDFEAMAGSADHCKHCEVEFMQHGKAKGCGKCGREACPTRPMRLGELPLITTTAYLDCANAALEAEREKSARLAGELAQVVDSMHDAIPRGALAPLLRNAANEALRRARLDGTPMLADHVAGAVAHTIAEIDAGTVPEWSKRVRDAESERDAATLRADKAERALVAATAPAEVARVTFRGVVSRVGKGEIEVKWTEGEMECSAWLPGWPGATIGDAVTVTARKG